MVPTANHDPTEPITGTDGPLLDERTRTVLNCLQDRTGPIPLSDLAADVANRGTYVQGQPDDSAATDVDWVRTRLHHVDLPLLHRAGFLDYDQADQLVVPLARAHREPMSLDTTFELLAHRYLRAVLNCLDEQRPLKVSELAAEVARFEHDAPTDDIPSAVIDRIHAALHHSHLPKLQQAGAVSIDRRDGLVTVGENAEWLLSAWRAVDATRRAGTAAPR